jgi:hypothetical protein
MPQWDLKLIDANKKRSVLAGHGDTCLALQRLMLEDWSEMPTWTTQWDFTSKKEFWPVILLIPIFPHQRDVMTCVAWVTTTKNPIWLYVCKQMNARTVSESYYKITRSLFKGYRYGASGRALALHAWGPVFSPQHHKKSWCQKFISPLLFFLPRILCVICLRKKHT